MIEKLDILVPVFKDPRIKRLLLSRNNAKGSDFARFIVWDGSGVNSLLEDCAHLLQNDDKWICKSDKGIFDAFNKLLQFSDSSIVVMMGADDYFGADFDFLSIINEFTQHDASVVFPRLEYFKGDSIKRSVSYNSYNSHSFYRGVPAYHCGTFLLKKTILDNYFDIYFETCADYGFFARLFRTEQNIVISDQLVRLESGGASGSWKARILALYHMNAQLTLPFLLRLRHFGLRYYYKIKSIL